MRQWLIILVCAAMGMKSRGLQSNMGGMHILDDTYKWNLEPLTPVSGAPCDCDSIFNQFPDDYKCADCP